jgi:hypothetical protein
VSNPYRDSEGVESYDVDGYKGGEVTVKVGQQSLTERSMRTIVINVGDFVFRRESDSDAITVSLAKPIRAELLYGAMQMLSLPATREDMYAFMQSYKRCVEADVGVEEKVFAL